jgi:hypothetical protein
MCVASIFILESADAVALSKLGRNLCLVGATFIVCASVVHVVTGWWPPLAVASVSSLVTRLASVIT